MHHDPVCPRCAGPVRSPSLWSSDWRCAAHGPVAPYSVLTHTGPDAVAHVVDRAGVPLWLPHGLPGGWVVTGLACAGDDRAPAVATATCLSGPSPLGGPADLLVIAEEPGVGLGARYAGLAEPDPGTGFGTRAPDAKLLVSGHPTALWSVHGDDERAVFVGEAKGVWLWLVVCPAEAGVVVYDAVRLVDLCDGDLEPALDFGSLSPRMQAEPAA